MLPKTVPTHLKAVDAYDPPPGDGSEQNAELPYATDGQLDTAWSTESYRTPNFGGLKQGVGIIVDTKKTLR